MMKEIRCVCGSFASSESIATLSVDSPEAESGAIVASLHQVLLRTTDHFVPFRLMIRAQEHVRQEFGVRSGEQQQ